MPPTTPRGATTRMTPGFSTGFSTGRLTVPFGVDKLRTAHRAVVARADRAVMPAELSRRHDLARKAGGSEAPAWTADRRGVNLVVHLRRRPFLLRLSAPTRRPRGRSRSVDRSYSSAYSSGRSVCRTARSTNVDRSPSGISSNFSTTSGASEKFTRCLRAIPVCTYTNTHKTAGSESWRT